SVYVPIEEIFNEERILDNRLSYSKGAALIHMIRFEIDNDSIFFQVLKNFNNQYSGGSATGMDFKDVIETTSGLDFTNFFNQWYFGEGYPIFDIYWTQNEDTIIINSIQTTSTTVTPLFVTPVEYKLVFSAGDTIIKVYQTQNDQTFKIYMPFTVNNLEVDPNNWLLNKVGVIHNSVNKINTKGNYFLIYPNPAEDFLYIEVLNDNKEFYFEIIDIFGKSVYNKIINTNKEIIDISNYSKGVYIVRVNGEDAIKVEKIIIY
ncbi:MAG: T9SS type A sorting domain-containing protein, partial [Bacteroidales bacterium]|nr:T9SS type A sorting domain-containing protein [Bacteroidales bacterium]